MIRPEIHSAFIERFSRVAGTDPVSDTELDQVEERLAIFFPQAYRDFVLSHGKVFTASLLGLIVKTGSRLWDVNDFFSVTECVDLTKMYHAGGMSERLIAFAGDSMGNVFCFEKNDLIQARPDDAPVWFFDHEFCKDERLYDSFDSWLKSYLALP